MRSGTGAPVSAFAVRRAPSGVSTLVATAALAHPAMARINGAAVHLRPGIRSLSALSELYYTGCRDFRDFDRLWMPDLISSPPRASFSALTKLGPRQ
jgi:hypothetical protein